MANSASDSINNNRYKRIMEIMLNQNDYHIKCHDCGQFLKKDRWVKKDHPWKKHGLCSDCVENYDDPMQF